MATETTPVALARSFTQAWTSHDMESAAGYLAADVVFDGPASHSVGADAYLKGLQAFASTVSTMKLLAALGDVSQALIMYEVTTPAGTLTCAEHLTFSGSKIQTDRLTFALKQIPANQVHESGDPALLSRIGQAWAAPQGGAAAQSWSALPTPAQRSGAVWQWRFSCSRRGRTRRPSS